MPIRCLVLVESALLSQTEDSTYNEGSEDIGYPFIPTVIGAAKRAHRKGELTYRQKEDNRLCNHDTQSHCSHKLHLLEHIHFRFGNGNLSLIARYVMLDGFADDDPGQRLRKEAHPHSKCASYDDVDPKYPIESHVWVDCNPFSNRTSQTGANVGAGDKERHCLSCIVRIAKKVRDSTRDVDKSDATSGATKELKDDKHGQVVGKGRSNAENRV